MPESNTIVPTNTTLDELKLQAELKMEFVLLGTTLVASYVKKEAGYTIFLMPTDEQANRGITITEMLSDIGTLIGGEVKADELIKCLQDLGGETVKVEDIQVSLNMAYLYIDNDGTNTVSEYAFQLNIDTSGLLPADFKLFNLKRMGVSVWNTNREKIISQMNLFKPEDLLK